MTMYETIKEAISVKQSAEHYGLKASRNGMACCPFHNDRHPSLKLNEDYFFCFGCGAKGDVIDLVARLFDLSGYEAAQRLAADFGISTKLGQAVGASWKPKRPHIRQFREDEMLCFRVLTAYLYLLKDWKVRGTHPRRRKIFWMTVLWKPARCTAISNIKLAEALAWPSMDGSSRNSRFKNSLSERCFPFRKGTWKFVERNSCKKGNKGI